MKLLRLLFFAAVNTLLYCAFCRQVKIFRRIVGYFPNIALPRKFHEKMLWRKIFDHNPLFVTFCDKLATKEYMRATAPELNIPRVLWVGRDLRQAPQELFRRSVVIKATHGSSFNHFTDADSLDLAQACKLAEQWMQTTYGKRHLEWGYFSVEKTIFVEERISADSPGNLLDIGIRCVDGKAILGRVEIFNKTEKMKLGYFNVTGERLCFAGQSPEAPSALPADFSLPAPYMDAVSLAEKLSKGVDYARYDFLFDGVCLHGGEITVYPAAGVTRATPEDQLGYDTILNPHWDLKKSWFLGTPQSGWKNWYAQALKTML